MSDFMFDKDDPLRRVVPGESRRANAALRDYVAMGGGRSLSKLLNQYRSSTPQQPPTKHQNTLKTWSARWQWQARLAAWEEAMQAEEEEHWRRRRVEIRRDDDALGKRLREVVEKFLEALPTLTQTRRVKSGERTYADPDTGETVREVTYTQFARIATNPGQLGQAAKAASDLQRAAAELETAKIKVEFSRMSDNELIGFVTQRVGGNGSRPGGNGAPRLANSSASETQD